MMDLSNKEAKELAIAFLMDDLSIPKDDQDFFAVLSARQTGSVWYLVEIGIAGLPDKWAIHVYDNRQCDPYYTFLSPMPAWEDEDLQEFPLSIADVVAAERSGGRV